MLGASLSILCHDSIMKDFNPEKQVFFVPQDLPDWIISEIKRHLHDDGKTYL